MAIGPRLVFAGMCLPLAIVAGISQDRAQPPQPSGLTIEVLDRMTSLPAGLKALPKPAIPRDNPQTKAKIDLGRILFLDKRLSPNSSIRCATCHDPDKAYSDGRPRAVGVNGAVLKRRSPSVLNSAYNSAQFWDGRVKTLEDQALLPVLSKDEMGTRDPRALIARLKRVPDYRRRFLAVFGREINRQDIGRAIASFERTLVTPNSAFDRYANGDKSALTLQQKRGLILFIGKASCSQCHNGPNFTDNKYYSLGTLPGPPGDLDLGRFVITRNAADRQAFKTPSLRASAQQGPFMHNGSIPTLAKVVEFYDQGGGEEPKSKLLFPLRLTETEKDDLIAFLRSLAGESPPDPGDTK